MDEPMDEPLDMEPMDIDDDDDIIEMETDQDR